jgi:hypothetical protein
MKLFRCLLVVFGFALPYLARLPRGAAWLQQYTHLSGLAGFLFLSAFNAIPVIAMLALTFVYRKRSSALFPAAAGFAFLGWHHAQLDLSADAQAAIALIFIPIYALAPIALGAGLGFLFDRLCSPARPSTGPHPSGNGS